MCFIDKKAWEYCLKKEKVKSTRIYCSIFGFLPRTNLNIQETQIESNVVHHEIVCFSRKFSGTLNFFLFSGIKVCSNFCFVRGLKDSETAFPASGGLVKAKKKKQQLYRHCICICICIRICICIPSKWQAR